MAGRRWGRDLRTIPITSLRTVATTGQVRLVAEASTGRAALKVVNGPELLHSRWKRKTKTNGISLGLLHEPGSRAATIGRACEPQQLEMPEIQSRDPEGGCQPAGLQLQYSECQHGARSRTRPLCCDAAQCGRRACRRRRPFVFQPANQKKRLVAAGKPRRHGGCRRSTNGARFAGTAAARPHGELTAPVLSDRRTSTSASNTGGGSSGRKAGPNLLPAIHS